MKNLLTTKCPECGTEINGKHMKPPFMNPPGDSNFYGGRVKKLIPATCDCGMELIAFLQPINNGYKVIDLAYKNEPEDIQNPEKNSKSAAGSKGNINLDSMERSDLIKYAKELEIPGKIATMSTEKLKNAISEKLKEGDKNEKDPEENGQKQSDQNANEKHAQEKALLE